MKTDANGRLHITELVKIKNEIVRTMDMQPSKIFKTRNVVSMLNNKFDWTFTPMGTGHTLSFLFKHKRISRKGTPPNASYFSIRNKLAKNEIPWEAASKNNHKLSITKRGKIRDEILKILSANPTQGYDVYELANIVSKKVAFKIVPQNMGRLLGAMCEKEKINVTGEPPYRKFFFKNCGLEHKNTEEIPHEDSNKKEMFGIIVDNCLELTDPDKETIISLAKKTAIENGAEVLVVKYIKKFTVQKIIEESFE